MEQRVQEIDSRIAALKEELTQVEGSKTEVYSRIVGYYRSVKNWNLGKKEEYKSRTPYTQLELERDAEVELKEEISPVTDKEEHTAGEFSSYEYYYRTSCPNCPAMKEALEQIDLQGEEINVDVERGLALASDNLVFSAPTVIFRDSEGKELFRTGHPSDVRGMFNLETVSA
ncbi:MAG: anaerobic ribonucleoside-triphosphate reductase [Spirochaetales bacterium]|nr:anaerobic ribonucleoside-triphosphate reductase [Spirochaetales bacterium]